MRSTLGFFLFLFLLGCDGSSPAPALPESTNVATDAIGVTLTVTSNGAAMLLDATIASANGPMRLGAGDVLSASTPDSPEKALGEYSPGHYALALTSQSTTCTISLLRNGKSASTTMLSLPTPFVISAPASTSRAMGLPLAWAPGVTGEQLALTVSGPCLPGMKLSRSPDPLGGGFTVQASDFSSQAGTCKLAIDVERTAAMSTALLGLAPLGGAKLVQSRNLEIVTDP